MLHRPCGQISPWHRRSRQMLQIRGLHTGVLGSLDRLLPGGLGFDDSRLGFPVQLMQLSRWWGASVSRAAAALALAPSASCYRYRAVAAAVSASISLRP